jgi:hypothetical protein
MPRKPLALKCRTHVVPVPVEIVEDNFAQVKSTRRLRMRAICCFARRVHVQI